MDKRCQKCGHYNPDWAKECEMCGAAMKFLNMNRRSFLGVAMGFLGGAAAVAAGVTLPEPVIEVPKAETLMTVSSEDLQHALDVLERARKQGVWIANYRLSDEFTALSSDEYIPSADAHFGRVMVPPILVRFGNKEI